MSTRIFAMLIAICAALCAPVALSQQAASGRTLDVSPRTEQRVALVIGNAAYKTAPLSNSVNDASDMASALQSMGFKVILRRNANTREMRQAIREFGVELRRAQVGLFYFAGHGIQVKGDNYLVPVGAEIDNEADAEDSAINANYALRTMEESQVKVSIVILDACRNNPFSRGFRSVSRGLAQMNAATGSLVAFATAPGAVAADGTGRNGVYTKHLLANLREGDPDISKVFQRTRAAVVRETGGKQTPWESTSLIGDFYVRAPTGGVQLASAPLAPTVAASPAAPPVVIPPVNVAGTSFKDCDDCPEMVRIPGGTFLMGSKADPFASSQPNADEQPQHQVSVKAFAMGKYEVTQEQWYAVMGNLPSSFKGRTLPVEQVTWNDAQEFVRRLGAKTGKTYRLPSEAEWEYAARAGSRTEWSFGDNENELGRYAWFNANSGSTTHPVGEKLPNAFGLHDMHGNVWEWTEDCWNENYNGAPSDGSVWSAGDCSRRVLRGGSWNFDPQVLRSAIRSGGPASDRGDGIGFRVSRTD